MSPSDRLFVALNIELVKEAQTSEYAAKILHFEYKKWQREQKLSADPCSLIGAGLNKHYRIQKPGEIRADKLGSSIESGDSGVVHGDSARY